MDQSTLLSIVVENDDEHIAVQVDRIIKYVLHQHYQSHAKMKSKGAGKYDFVVSGNEDDFSILRESAIPFLQNVVVFTVRAQGWPVDLHRAYAKQQVSLEIWGGAHFFIRQIQSDLIDGTRVTFCSADGIPEYSVRVGGPFQTNSSIHRAFCYGHLLGVDVCAGMTYARFRDLRMGERRFLVEDPAWPERFIGRTLFLTLARYRGKGGCWKLNEWIELDRLLSEEWPIPPENSDSPFPKSSLVAKSDGIVSFQHELHFSR